MIVMSSFKSPAYNVKAVPVEKIVANSYNPNVVAPPEMKLLELSIWEDGFTMPCVCYYDREKDNYILVDGYHRYQVLKTSKRIYQRENGLLPVVVIAKELSNRLESTIRHNRARGAHNIELMCNIVKHELKTGISFQMGYILFRTGEEIVQAYYFVPVFNQPGTQMRTYKAGTTANHYFFHAELISVSEDHATCLFCLCADKCRRFG